MVLHDRDILLEKRPPGGIWGGLWSLPELDGTEEPNFMQRNGLVACSRSEQPPFTHTFTHFRLQITPVLLRVAGKPLLAGEPGSQWADLRAALQMAIPAPVRRLLLGLALESA